MGSPGAQWDFHAKYGFYTTSFGALGIGWDITGVSAISRGMQSFYFDETSEGKIDATTIQERISIQVILMVMAIRIELKCGKVAKVVMKKDMLLLP